MYYPLCYFVNYSQIQSNLKYDYIMCKCYALNLHKILKFSCWFSKFCHSLTAQLHLDLQEIAKLPFCSSWSMSYAGDIQCILWRWGRFSYFNLIWCFCVSVQNFKKMKSVLHLENYSLYTKSCNDSLPCHLANDFPSSFAVFAIYLEWAPVGPHSVLLR